jgi:hypothetical protein
VSLRGARDAEGAIDDPLAALSIGVFTESHRTLPSVWAFLRLLNVTTHFEATI